MRLCLPCLCCILGIAAQFVEEWDTCDKLVRKPVYEIFNGKQWPVVVLEKVLVYELVIVTDSMVLPCSMASYFVACHW